MFIPLNRDRNYTISSLDYIKGGKNKGFLKKEIDGQWEYITGYCYEALSVEQRTHNIWANELVKLGFRVGILHSDGCLSFYIFKENKDIKSTI